MQTEARPFRNLNRDGLWPEFFWDGLELGPDGALRLSALPRLDGVLPHQLPARPAWSGPAGLAVDRDGSIYFSDPASGRIYRVNGCSGEREAAPCIGGVGEAPTQFDEPTALLISRHRRVLYVADSGNHRIQMFDPETMAVVGILTGFERPVSLASDEAGHLYVVDVQARRVHQFTVSGDVVASFSEAVLQSGRVAGPRAVACEDDRIYVLDGETRHVCVFDAAGALIEEVDTGIADAAVLIVIAGVVYVGDPGRLRIAVYRRNRQGLLVYAGDAAGYEGPVAALASDLRGGLLVSPGWATTPARLHVDASYRSEGIVWSGPLDIDGLPHFWNGLHASVDLGTGAHVQFFVHTGPPAPPAPVPDAPTPFPAPWRPVNPDVTDFFVGGAEARSLWVGALFTNDQHSTPVLSQLRVELDQESYLPYLPAIYRERGCDDFLLRYVSLFESFFRELEAGIDRLPALLHPAAAPAEALPWLAGFLALALPDTLSDAEQRAAIAGAFARYARRGTVAGLREALRVEAGVRAVIDEPLQATGWWSLPEHSRSCKRSADTWEDGADSVLGFNTVLASAEPQGAVVGTTATLDRSQLIGQDEYGSTLFDGVAHQFTVRVYPGEMECPGKIEQVTAIIDREKPAHTTYELCVISPGLRIGYQSRLGIETLVGGGPVPTRLGDGTLVLAGHPRGRIGVGSRVGLGTQL